MSEIYYKTNKAEVLKAFFDFFDKKKDYVKNCEKFADLFRDEHKKVTCVYINNIHHFKFEGLQFSPNIKSKLWTMPEKNGGHQWPKAKVSGLTDIEKQERKHLSEKWKLIPTDKVEKEPIFKSIGTDWGNVAFSDSGFNIFEFDGFVFVMTAAKLSDFMVEILASEFNQAKVKNNEQRH